MIEKLGKTFFESGDAVDQRIELLRAMLLEFRPKSFDLVAQVYGQLLNLLALSVGVFLQVETKFFQVDFLRLIADFFGKKVDLD